MMDNINEFYKRFVDEAYDENGVVCKFDLDLPDNYNFAYDVIDEIAKPLSPKELLSIGSARTARSGFSHTRSFPRKAASSQYAHVTTALKRAIW